MREVIIEKINNEIEEGIKKECQVVYIMVELRKLLDQLDQTDCHEKGEYKLIRFYADWVVHISKDRTEAIREVMGEINREVTVEVDFQKKLFSKKTKMLEFIYMDKLRNEMKELFIDKSINAYLLDDDNLWINFVSLLAKILADQPIIKPLVDEKGNEIISKFSFASSVDGAAIWEIHFKDSRGSMKFGNVY